eukprot:6183807-Pleurochrysis_carterae.AAC.2
MSLQYLHDRWHFAYDYSIFVLSLEVVMAVAAISCKSYRLVAARAGTDLGHFETACPVPRAITGLSALV